jgi:hypothetical protein
METSSSTLIDQILRKAILEVCQTTRNFHLITIQHQYFLNFRRTQSKSLNTGRSVRKTQKMKKKIEIEMKPTEMDTLTLRERKN